MAKERTDKSRFPSRYDGGWVSNAQYLTECLCVLIAKNEKKELFDNFWQKEPWTAIFRRQVPLAVKLLQIYDADIILAAMRDRRCWKMRSFGAKWLLEPLLKEKQRQYDAKAIVQKNTTTLTDTSTTKRPRRPVSTKAGKKSLFTQLKNIDDR